jgi:hypothetical protein
LLNLHSLDALSGNLRGYLLDNLPTPLVEGNQGWGHTECVKSGLQWKGRGFNLRPVWQISQQNHGPWRKVKVSALDLPHTLVVDLGHLQLPDPGRLTFHAFLSFDARLEYDYQHWSKGRKLLDDNILARMRLKLDLDCEATTRLEPGGGLLPEAVFRLRVTQADLRYDNFVTEHLAGVGGEAARLLGQGLRTGLRQWHPSLERDLLARAEAAIVKAGDTREVRLNLAGLFLRVSKMRGTGTPKTRG